MLDIPKSDWPFAVQPAHQQTQSAQGPQDQDACNSVGMDHFCHHRQWIENHTVTFFGEDKNCFEESDVFC